MRRHAIFGELAWRRHVYLFRRVLLRLDWHWHHGFQKLALFGVVESDFAVETGGGELPLGDRTVIEHCVSTIIAAGIKDIVVVHGHDAGDVSKTIHHFPVRTVLNTQQESEMAESVRSGLKSVSADATGILICLADHPLVMPETVKALVALHKNYPEAIIIPSC